MLAAARLCAFTGSYLMLVMIVLIARIPWLERTVGQDRLVRWHRTIGGWPIVLIALHIVLVTLGYAAMTRSGFLHQFWTFLIRYPDMLAALVAFGLLVMAGVSSYRLARQNMKYETWWVVHLYIYVALALAFTHQIRTGVMFLAHPLLSQIWTGVWITAAALIVLSRVLWPIANNLRWRLRVADVVAEAPGVYSLTVTGHGLSRLAVSGGQFFQWRFLTRGLWWHSHPYSLSALPRPPFLRVTVKGLGDQSSAIARLAPGTRVFVEGPYGTFTRHARATDRVVLAGAGVGITPLRALVRRPAAPGRGHGPGEGVHTRRPGSPRRGGGAGRPTSRGVPRVDRLARRGERRPRHPARPGAGDHLERPLRVRPPGFHRPGRARGDRPGRPARSHPPRRVLVLGV